MVSTTNCTVLVFAVLPPGQVPASAMSAYWHTEPEVKSWTVHDLSWSVLGVTEEYVVYHTGTMIIHGSPLPFASCATWVDLWLWGGVKETLNKQSSLEGCREYYEWP